MKRFLALLLSLLTALPAYAQSPIIWGPNSSATALSSGPIVTAAGRQLADGGAPDINYVLNPGLEVAVTGWSTYADAAAATPVDCTGGSPNLTFARNTTTPIRGLGDGKISKDAANRQGNGVSYAFTIDRPDKSKKLSATFDYDTDEDAAYASGDLAVYVYDVTNGTLITPDFPSVPRGEGTWPITWDATGSTSYRLCFHVATTNASAWDDYIDNVVVGPRKIVQVDANGYLGTLSLTPSASFGTVTATQFNGWRTSNRLKVVGRWTNGTTSGSAAILDLPAGYTIDYNAISSNSQGIRVGTWTTTTASSNAISSLDHEGPIFVDGSDADSLFFASMVASSGFQKNFPNGFASNSGTTTVEFEVPIQEWAGAVNVAQASDCEYASVAGTWDASSTTTVYGPAGSLMGGALTDRRLKTITWQSPISPTDRVEYWGSKDQISWFPLASAQLGSSFTVVPMLDATGSQISGVSYRSINSTQTGIEFFRYISAASDDSPANDWPSSSAYWVATKCRAGVAAGFGIARDGNSGLINYYREDDTTLAAVTFSGNAGGSASSSIAVKITRVGRIVTLTIPQLVSVVPTSNSSFLLASTALPTWARPSTQQRFITPGYNNGADLTTPSKATIDTDGLLRFYRDESHALYTNSANAGFRAMSLTYGVN